MHPVFYLFFVLFLTPWGELMGQENAVSASAATTAPYCGSDQLHQRYLAADPTAARRWDAAETAYRNWLGSPKMLAPSYTLPVVFHVVHNGGAENIDDSRILASFGRLNEAFANLGYYDQGTGVDTEIEFCLARRSPDNAPSTGINRVQSALTEVNMDSEDLDLKNLIRWNPREYINVWVVREICSSGGLGCGVAGYAYLPGAHGSSVDGIVLEARWLSENPAHAGVLIHEMGHYLGLYHTFEGACANDDCLAQGDRVCDTPPDQSTAPVPCNGTANTCDTDTNSGFATDQPDMFINYMDYGNWNCYSAFSGGQRDRMHFFVENTRRSLLDSPGCLDPCPALQQAAFVASATDITVGTEVTFTNQSTNAFSYQWLLNGVPFANTTQTSFTFNTTGSFEVTLQALSNDPLCLPVVSAPVTITVVCPVTAGFVPSVAQPIPGDVVQLTSTATNATLFNWTVNGIPVGASDNLAYTFPAPGLYQVCQTAGNGLCEATVCQFLVASQPPANNDCYEPYVFYFADAELDVRGATLAAEGGNLYVGGGRGRSGLVIKLGPAGNLIWQQELFASSLPAAEVLDLRFDSEGMLIGCGSARSPNFTTGFAFRMDPEDGSLIWARTYQTGGNTSFVPIDIYEISPGGNYLMLGGSNNNPAPGLGCDATLHTVERSTGNLVAPSTHYNLGSCEDFSAVIYENGTFYGTGRYNFAGGGVNRMRPAITAFDPQGQPIWSRLYLVNVNQDARLYSSDIVRDGNFLHIFISGDNAGVQGSTNRLWLLRTNLAGGALWARQYTYPEVVTTQEVIPTAGGYFLLARSVTGSNLYLTRTDNQGLLLWTRRLPGLSLAYNTGDEAIAAGDNLYLTATLPGSPSALALLRFDADGNLPAGCLPSEDITLGYTSIPSPYDGFHALTVYDSPFNTGGDFGVEPTNLAVLPLSCEPLCNEEICGNGIDDDQDGLTDCEDPDIQNSCCCYTPRILDLPAEVAFCEGEVFSLHAGPGYSSYLWSTGVTDSILRVLVGGVYWVSVQDSCGLTQTDTVVVRTLTPATLDLGPDLSLCENGVTILDPGPGFTQYLWFDGSTQPVYTAFGPGDYWVTVQDSCGRTLSDTIRISTDPATVIDLGPDVQLDCGGGPLSLTVTGNFVTLSWFPATAVDCDNCPTVNFVADTTTTLTVVGANALGCLSVDTIRISVPEAGTGSTTAVNLCAGDSLQFGGQTITSGGLYFDTIQLGACPRIDTLAVTLLPNLLTEAQLSICQGQSAVIFGETRTQPGVYEATFTSAAGCDSLHRVTLSVLPNFTGRDTVVACQGDVVLIFGQPRTVAGPYTQTFVAANGCDSVHTTVLQLIPQVTTQSLVGLCDGEGFWFGNQYITAPGSYRETFMAANGCDSVHTVIVRRNQVTYIEEGITICQGETALVFGEPQSQSGEYVQVSTGPNGCDLYHTIILSVEVMNVQIVIGSPQYPGDPDGITATADVLGGTLPYTFEWNVPGGEYGRLTNLGPGTYTVTVTSAIGCVATASVTLSSFLGFDLSISDPSCHGEEDGAILMREVESGFSFSLDGRQWATTPGFFNLAGGEYTLYARNAAGYVWTHAVTLTEPEPLWVSLPDDQTLRQGERIRLEAQTNAGPAATYLWNPEQYVDCKDCATVMAQPIESTRFRLLVRDLNGCTATDDILLKVDRRPAYYVPTAFSPNGDGQNDWFTVFGGAELREIRTLQVFNRWGEEVFVRRNFPPNREQLGWDGRFRGEPLNPAVFVYRGEVELANGDVAPIQGEVVLVR